MQEESLAHEKRLKNLRFVVKSFLCICLCSSLISRSWLCLLTIVSVDHECICMLFVQHREDLDLTRNNYEDQIKMMTEHIVSMQEKLAIQEKAYVFEPSYFFQ